MNTGKAKITLHMVASLDGMIARKDNSVSWFETTDFYEKGAAESGEAEVLSTIDCYVMGSRTYQHALDLSAKYGWAYGDTPTIVLTSRELPAERKNITFYSGDLRELVQERLDASFRKVWVVGGSQTAKAFMDANLVHEVRMSVLPIVLGGGTPFFGQTKREHPLHLKDVTAFRSGMVELCYEILR